MLVVVVVKQHIHGRRKGGLAPLLIEICTLGRWLCSEVLLQFEQPLKKLFGFSKHLRNNAGLSNRTYVHFGDRVAQKLAL